MTKTKIAPETEKQRYWRERIEEKLIQAMSYLQEATKWSEHIGDNLIYSINAKTKAQYQKEIDEKVKQGKILKAKNKGGKNEANSQTEDIEST